MKVWPWFRDMVHNRLFSRQTFEFLQRFRINITKNYHYSPIPDVRNLRSRNIWGQETSLAGVRLQEIEQLEEIEAIVKPYLRECNFPLDPTLIPYEYYMRNGTYGWLCATLYFSLIRHYKPSRIIEVGAGQSTYLAAQAVRMNKTDGVSTELVAVEPFPNPVLQSGFDGLSQVVPQKVEDLNLDFFSSLQAGDILFIDSTHTVKVGGDVIFLFLEVLPRLSPGVLIHVHDIYWPQHYPPKFILDQHFFWSEQYLLQAFMMFNDHFQILWAGNYLTEKHPEKIREIFPLLGGISEHEAVTKYDLHYSSNSFWMQRVEA